MNDNVIMPAQRPSHPVFARRISPLQTAISGDSTLENEQSLVHVYDSHAEVEVAIRALSRSGFDVKKLSLVGKGYHSDAHAVGFYAAGDHIKTWGTIGGFWGGIWGLLLAPAVFFLPGLGLMAMAGPVVAVLVDALERAVVVDDLSPLGAALTMIGISKKKAIIYETALQVDKYVLMAQGSAKDVLKAYSILAESSRSGTA